MKTKRSSLIVVHGAPASGKTYFSHWLSRQLNLPVLSKDDIKEELFSHFDYSSVEQSKNIGAASFDLLWLWLSKLMPHGQDLIIETAFFAKYSQPKIIDLAQNHNYRIIQIFCHADEQVRHQRYIDRAHGSARHPGHMDKQRLAEFNTRAANEYQAMDLPGTLITLDTTSLDDLSYQDVLQQVTQELNRED
jgi:predicted kinase